MGAKDGKFASGLLRKYGESSKTKNALDWLLRFQVFLFPPFLPSSLSFLSNKNKKKTKKKNQKTNEFIEIFRIFSIKKIKEE